MAAASNLSTAAVAAMIAALKASGVDIENVLTKKSETKTATTESASVKFIPTFEDEATSHKRKANAAEGSGTKRTKSTPGKVPVQKSFRTKKTPISVVKKEKSIHEAEEEESLKGRSVIPEMIVDREFMARYQLVKVSDLLIAQNWDHLFREAVLVDEAKVREFYTRFKLEEVRGMPLATFVVGGEEQVFSCRELANLLKVPATGFDEYVKGIWPESVAKGEVIKRVGEDPTNVSHQGKATTLNLVNRILHKLICTSVTPRAQKHEVVNFQDFFLLDKLRGKTQINLPMLILKHMERAASSKSHGLPYPGIIKRILVHLGIYEPKKESEQSSVLGEDMIASFNWEFEAGTGWKSDLYTPAPVTEEVIHKVDPLDQHLLHPVKGSPAVVKVLQNLCERVDVLGEKVAHLKSLIEKESRDSNVEWVSELRSKLDAIESLPAVVREIDESAKINMINGTRIREEIAGLNRQLRFVGTELVAQLRLLVKE